MTGFNDPPDVIERLTELLPWAIISRRWDLADRIIDAGASVLQCYPTVVSHCRQVQENMNDVLAYLENAYAREVDREAMRGDVHLPPVSAGMEPSLS